MSCESHLVWLVFCGSQPYMFLHFCEMLFTLNEWGELASHERLFNPPVLDLKARHSVFFIFSVIYILYMFLPSIFYFLSGCDGGCGPGRLGCSVQGRTSYIFLSLIVFLTFLFFGGLCPLQASVYKFLLEGRPLWSLF